MKTIPLLKFDVEYSLRGTTLTNRLTRYFGIFNNTLQMYHTKSIFEIKSNDSEYLKSISMTYDFTPRSSSCLYCFLMETEEFIVMTL